MKEKKIDELVAKYFTKDNLNSSENNANESLDTKMDAYSTSNELERMRKYASSIIDNDTKDGQILTIANSLEYSIALVKMHSTIPEAFKRETMRYFNSRFADFDKNAAVSLGKQLKNALESVEVNTDPKNGCDELQKMIIERLTYNSKNKFFIELRSDARKRRLFKERLKTYCEAVWSIEMQKSGTIFSGDTLAERIANQNRDARKYVQEFIEEKCRVNRRSTVRTDDLYGFYEKWVTENEIPIVGKRTFLDELYKQVPFAIQGTKNGETVLEGLKLAM